MCAANATLPAQALAVEPIAVPGLPSVRITEIVETDDQRLWFGGVDGLWLHDGRMLKEIALPEVGEGPRRVRRLCAAGDDLLIALTSGVGRVAADSERVEMLPGLDDVQASHVAWLPDGTMWLRTAEGAISYRNGQRRSEATPGATRLGNFVVGSSHLWSWDDERVWARPLGGRGGWLEVAKLGVNDLQRDGDGVLAIGSAGLAHLQVDRPLHWLRRDGHGHGVARNDDLLWVRRDDQLLVAQPDGGPLREVQFFRSGSAATDLQVYRVFRSSSGLLWLGTQLGVMRLNLCPGVDNLVIDGMLDQERPGALLELADGRLLVGSNRGRLLVSEARWGAPWRDFSPTWPGEGSINCLLQDPKGRVWVGTQLHGLWCGGDGTWQRIGGDQPLRGVRSLHWFGDALWICSVRRVLRYDVDGGGGLEAMWIGEEHRGKPSSLQVDRDGRLWLATYRAGLRRFDPASSTFKLAALADDSVLRVAVDPGGRQLVAATTHELWTIDSKTDVAHPWPALGRSAFRDLQFDGDGTLWQTRSRQLLQFDNRQIREVGPGTGAHPLGYAYQASTRLRDGDLLFGAHHGLTRVRCGADLAAIGRARLLGFELFDAETGSIIKGRPGQNDLRVSPSFRVTPQVLDRSIDLPLGCSVRLEPLDADRSPLVGPGDFEHIADGRYHASVVVLQVNGSTAELSLGTLLVAPVTMGPTPWLIGAALMLLIGVAWWRMRRLVVDARRPALERVLAEAGHDPDEVLDLAFVVVGAAEACLAASGALRASAWIRVGALEPTLLAEFGAETDPALQCLAELTQQGPGWHSCACDGHREILIALSGAGELRFQVLLIGVHAADDEVRPAIERALQPARAALDRSIWVDRLQAFCVNSSLAIEADLHDLRSSLTVLRLGVAELRRERGGLDPLIGNLGNATEALLQAVKRLQSPRAMQLALENPLTIVRAVLDATQAIGSARGIRVTLRASATATLVRLDPVWFRRALENVVGNALKYSDDGGAIDVSLLEVGDALCIRIDDAGPGIDAEERSRLFLPGVVGKAQPRNGESKTGIGLWVSRQAMRAMGGTMWIEPRPGGGTRVVLQLPREPQGAAVVPPLG